MLVVFVLGLVRRFTRNRLCVVLAGLCLGAGVGGARLAAGQSAAQPGAEGDPATLQPIIRTFAAGDYDGSDQLWAVTQDTRGLLYIGGQRYLRQYDGVRWRGSPRLSTTNSSPAYDLAVGPAGAVYAGLLGAVNVLRPDTTETLRAVAVQHAVPDSLTGPREAFAVAASSDAVMVRTGPALWRVRGDSLHRIAPSLRARRLLRVGDRFIVQCDSALVAVAGDAAGRRLLVDPRLQDASLVAVLAPRVEREDEHNRRGLIVLGDGLYRWMDDRLTRVRTNADARIERETLNDAVRLSDGTVALATATRGILVVDPETGRFRVVNAASGLPSNEVTDLHVSDRGALWAATVVGLARIAWPAPWTRVVALRDRLAQASTLMRTEGGLYVGGTGGLFRLRDGAAQRVTGIEATGTVYDAATFDDDLLVTAVEGVYAVQGRTARRVADWSAYGLLRSRQRPGTAYVGLLDGGLGRLRRVEGRWQPDGRIRAVDGRGYRVAEDTTGAVWIGTGSSGLYRVVWPERNVPPPAEPQVAHYDTTDGLPAPSFNFVAQVGDAVRALTLEGLYRFDRSTRRFTPDAAFAAVYADSILTGWPVEARSAAEVWMDFGGYKFGRATRRPDGTYAWTARPFRRLADLGDVEAIYPDGDSLVWVGTAEGLFRYDRRRASLHDRPFRAFIRSVTINPDAPPNRVRRAFGGDVPRPDGLRLPYADNTLRIAFGATSYEQVEGPLFERGGPLQFRYWLDGYDADWSAWSSEAQKDYTGLPEGAYTVRVQARNLYNQVGETATLRLIIAPPWYRTWWAYLIYALGAAGGVAGLVVLRTRRLQRRKEELEATVRERTSEVRAQAEQLERQKDQMETQKDQLAQQADELRALDRAKSRFFANLSHEFRTPLTLILGPVRRVHKRLRRRRDSALQEAADRLAVVERNAYRLLRMVRQLLDLARHDAGTLQVRARPVDLSTHVDDIVKAFVPLAERQELALTLQTTPPPSDAAPVYLDPELFEQILGNLLSNAIKFTPSGECVNVHVEETAHRATVTVADTGPGIPEDLQAHIFERFAQADDTTTRRQEGTGIGLALTQTLVDQHGGTVSVDSMPEDGATFTVTFPRGRAHLTDDQVADSSDPRPAPATEDSEATVDASRTVREIDGIETADTDPSGTDAGGDEENDDTPLVLVVDDNPDIRDYVRSVLAPAFRVVEAATGTEGVQRARNHLPDVILADVMMPEMDGLTMTQTLREDSRTAAIPVVMLTARAGTDDEVEGLSAGATDYVVKPFDPQVLEMRVRGTLAYQQRLRRRLLAELRETVDSVPDSDDASTESDAEGGEEDAVAPFETEMRAVIARRLPDPDFGPDALAEALAMSRATLYRRARDADAPSPAALIRTMRLDRGAELLDDGAGSVSQVAYAVGFQSLSHFSRRFADHVGMSPTEYAASSEDA